MSEFKKGDRVRIVREFESPQLKSVYDGMTGTIEAIFPDNNYKYFVRLDEFDHATVFYEVEHLKKHPVIVITTDGVTTTATKRLGKKVLGTAYSKCAPADTFDYDTGVGLALARLCGFEIKMHEEEETPMQKQTEHFKVVCTSHTLSASALFKVGQTYDAYCEKGCLPVVIGSLGARYIGNYYLSDPQKLYVAFGSNQMAHFVRLIED